MMTMTQMLQLLPMKAAVIPASNKVANMGDKAGKTAGAGYKAMGGWTTKWRRL